MNPAPPSQSPFARRMAELGLSERLKSLDFCDPAGWRRNERGNLVRCWDVLLCTIFGDGEEGRFKWCAFAPGMKEQRYSDPATFATEPEAIADLDDYLRAGRFWAPPPTPAPRGTLA